jgi:hypothetical protein
LGTKLIEIRGEIKETLSLMLNEESICINPKPSTKKKKSAETQCKIA